MVVLPPLLAPTQCALTAPPQAMDTAAKVWATSTTTDIWPCKEQAKAAKPVAVCAGAPAALFLWKYQQQIFAQVGRGNMRKREKFEHFAQEGIENYVESSVGSAKLEWGKEERTNFHTRDKGDELKEAFRECKMQVHRGKDKKKGEGE